MGDPGGSTHNTHTHLVHDNSQGRGEIGPIWVIHARAPITCTRTSLGLLTSTSAESAAPAMLELLRFCPGMDGPTYIHQRGTGREQRRVRRSRWKEAGRMEMRSGKGVSRRRGDGGMAGWRDGGMAGCAPTSKLNLSGGCLRIFTSNSLHRMKRI